MAGNDEVKKIIGDRGGIALIIETMNKQLRSEKVPQLRHDFWDHFFCLFPVSSFPPPDWCHPTLLLPVIAPQLNSTNRNKNIILHTHNHTNDHTNSPLYATPHTPLPPSTS